MTDLIDRPLETWPPDPAGPTVDADEPPDRLPPLRRWWSRVIDAPVESWLTFITVAATVLIVLGHLSPSNVVANTTPTGGDLGAQVWGPAFLRDYLLEHGWVTGWAPDWYAGFPMYQFYMVVPALFVLVLDVVLPYGIALKLITVAGSVTLPIAVWAFARASKLRFPMPALMAAASAFFLFDDSYTIYGGNIASTMAGEYSFSLALTLCFFYFAALSAGLRTGKHRGWAALLFALAALSHLIVFFFALIGTIVMLVLHLDRNRFRYVFSTSLVAGMLMAFWMVPFFWRRHYLTDMGYEKIARTSEIWKQLWFPNTVWWDRGLFALALLGFLGSVIRWRRAGTLLGLLCLIYAAWIPLQPQAQFWNARLLPFLHISRYLLAAIGLAEIGFIASTIIGRGRRTRQRNMRIATLAVGALVGYALLGMTLRDMLPFGRIVTVTKKGTAVSAYQWGPFENTKAALGPFWAKWGFSGYERKPAYGEYRALVETMAKVGNDYGCGRALYENNNDIGSYGTSLALMLLPFWTDGCIGAMEGLYFEASATTPYHFVTAAALSDRSSNPVRRLRYLDSNVDLGVKYLQRLGVRYYLAYGSSVVAQAERNEQLTPIATSGPWHIYGVAGSDLVEPLTTQPVVVTGLVNHRLDWLDVAMEWFQRPDTDWKVPIAASGPDEWTRVDPQPLTRAHDSIEYGSNDRYADLPATALPEVRVTNVRRSDNRITFSVDRVGVPVLVKESYYPNWKASGAKGPYRVAPNQMVVVPTDTEVELYYGRTPVDVVPLGVSLVGIGALVWLWRRPRLEYPIPQPPEPHWTEVHFNPPAYRPDGDELPDVVPIPGDRLPPSPHDDPHDEPQEGQPESRNDG